MATITPEHPLTDLLEELAEHPLGPWVLQARCRDLGEGADVFTDVGTDRASLTVAAKICRRCPVQLDCDQFAEDTYAYGFWAGRWRSFDRGPARKIPPRPEAA